MRPNSLCVVVSLACWSSIALAQQQSQTIGRAPSSGAVTQPPTLYGIDSVNVAPAVGSPLFPGTKAGLDKPADDGIYTKTVKAAPCSTAARETDGTTPA